MGASARETTDTQFWTLDIGENANRPVESLFQVSDHRESFGMILMCAMREIQSEDVGASLEQTRQNLRRGTRWAERRDDFRAAPSAQLWASGHGVSFKRSGWRGSR